MNRLESISKELSDSILNTTKDKQRKVILICCKYGIGKSGMESPLVMQILEDFAIGDLQSAHKEIIERLVDEFDSEYFDTQEAEERNERNKGDHLIPFGKARALSTVLYCFDDNTASASVEAVYEASMIDGNNAELFKTIKNLLTD